jgi:hypothetical protein
MRRRFEVIIGIENAIFSKINLGVSWKEFRILNDVNASKRAIQDLGARIATGNPELSVAILGIARSIYFGYSRRGEVDFF